MKKYTARASALPCSGFLVMRPTLQALINMFIPAQVFVEIT